jgi:hypothetical protein
MRWARGVSAGILLVALVGPARADEQAPTSPAELLNGPSLHETGRIAAMTIAPLEAAPETLQPRPDTGDRGERSIQKVAAAVDKPLPPRAGTINPGTLEREIQERFAPLDDCRIDVARRQRVAPADVRADVLILRWTIRRNGEAGRTDVVAVSPTDLDVMDCVKAAMSTWTFTRPQGGPVPVEREFRFRPVP